MGEVDRDRRAQGRAGIAAMKKFAGIAQARVPDCFPIRRRGIEPAPRSRLYDYEAWQQGRDDAIAGRRRQITPEDLIHRAGSWDIIAYLSGYRAGEIDRARENLKGDADAL